MWEDSEQNVFTELFLRFQTQPQIQANPWIHCLSSKVGWGGARCGLTGDCGAQKLLSKFTLWTSWYEHTGMSSITLHENNELFSRIDIIRHYSDQPAKLNNRRPGSEWTVARADLSLLCSGISVSGPLFAAQVMKEYWSNWWPSHTSTLQQ